MGNIMSKDQSISIIMKKHHGQIEGLLNSFFKLKDTSDDKLKLFNCFKWELEKHFFTEERAIFFFIDAEDEKINEMKMTLMKEHDKILASIKQVENELREEKDLNIDGLKGLLTNHKQFEDKNFYPTLDNDLDPEKKKNIMDRLSNPL
jgi:hypothetical protein